MNFDRLLIVSNRLPLTVRLEDGMPRLHPSEGGLATGLRPFHGRSDDVWIGWPGDVSTFTPAQRAELDSQLQQLRLVPVYLSEQQVDCYYHGFSNGVLWPLFHYSVDRVPIDARGWDSYRNVNETFADRLASIYRRGDAI